MYILLAVVAAAALGIAVHFLTPGRALRGVAVAPMAAAAVAGVTYTALQWFGVGEDSPVLWLSSIAGGVVTSAVVAAWIYASRARADRRERDKLRL